MIWNWKKIWQVSNKINVNKKLSGVCSANQITKYTIGDCFYKYKYFKSVEAGNWVELNLDQYHVIIMGLLIRQNHSYLGFMSRTTNEIRSIPSTLIDFALTFKYM